MRSHLALIDPQEDEFGGEGGVEEGELHRSQRGPSGVVVRGGVEQGLDLVQDGVEEGQGLVVEEGHYVVQRVVEEGEVVVRDVEDGHLHLGLGLGRGLA